jgi:hypothetical protein
MPEEVKLYTVGRIAELFNIPSSIVSKVLRNNPGIRPVARAGNARIFDSTGVMRILTVLQTRGTPSWKGR